MIDGLPGLVAIGVVAAAGFMMVRTFNDRRERPGPSSDSSLGFWPGTGGDGGNWFSNLFGSSGSQDGGGGSDSSSSSSDSSGGGDGGGGGGGGD